MTYLVDEDCPTKRLNHWLRELNTFGKGSEAEMFKTTSALTYCQDEELDHILKERCQTKRQ